MFESFYKWLKPGGKILITDYCRSAGTASPEFAGYIKQRGYDLHDVEEYGKVLHLHLVYKSIIVFFVVSMYRLLIILSQMLANAGFDDVMAEDRTDQVQKTSSPS